MADWLVPVVMANSKSSLFPRTEFRMEGEAR